MPDFVFVRPFYKESLAEFLSFGDFLL